MEENHIHSHQHQTNLNSNNLFYVVTLNILITAAEVIGGVISGSLALLSDSLHNLSDVLSLILSFIANKISYKKHTLKNTFGFKRTEILVALLNSATIIAISFFLFYEAFKRLLNPSSIDSVIMLIVAVIGLIGNGISVFFIKKDAKENLNIKSAYLHLLADTFSSIAVIVGGILIYFFHIIWVDPLLTFIIGIYVIKEGISILMEALDILMQATPSNIDIEQIQKIIEQIPEVNNLHHVHVWKLNDKEIHFEAHLDFNENVNLSKVEEILAKVRSILYEDFNIYHTTIQPEINTCCNKQLLNDPFL